MSLIKGADEKDDDESHPDISKFGHVGIVNCEFVFFSLLILIEGAMCKILEFLGRHNLSTLANFLPHFSTSP